jgi:hypothetical protein
VLGQGPGEVLPDAGQAALRVDGEAPQAGAALGVAERLDVVDAGHRAEDATGARLLGDEVGEDRSGLVAEQQRGSACSIPAVP